MRVLLVSPVDPEVPSNLKFLMGGENTYTRTLLSHPPSGVSYVHHLQALESGEIRYGKLYQPLSMLVKFRLLPLSAGTVDIEVLGDFDLVHCHAYTLRIANQNQVELPVVMGDSIPTKWSLSNYFVQNKLRIETGYLFRSLVHKALGIYDQDLSLGNFKKLIVMSEFAKAKHLELGANAERIEVIYPGLPDRGARKKRNKGKINILFAGVWFERKGGDVLLRAYTKLGSKYKDKVSLTILGPISANWKNNLPEGVINHEYVSYSRLVNEFYRNADILVHVPPEAEGYGLVVEEAMSFGIPCIVAKIGALTEMIVDQKTGIVVRPGYIDELTKAMEQLIEDEKLREEMGRQARVRFTRFFSLKIMQEKLLRVYKEAIKNSV